MIFVNFLMFVSIDLYVLVLYLQNKKMNKILKQKNSESDLLREEWPAVMTVQFYLPAEG